MQEAKITLRNYRAFADSKPVSFEIGPRFVAFVGPNNSGKSSLLRMFYELREFWRYFTENNYLQCLFLQDWTMGFNYQRLSDSTEIFFDGNLRPISIEIELPKSLPPLPYSAAHLTKVVAWRHREAPDSWRFDAFTSLQPNTPCKTKPHSVPWKETGVLVLDGIGPVDMRAMRALMGTLASTMYIGPFRNAINEGAANYYDLSVGTQFIATWNAWKTGPQRNHNRAAQSISSDIERIFEFDSLEINSSSDQTTLSVYVNRKPYRLAELGAGLTQFILVLANAAIQKPSLILIDEPELNLHPRLQIDFLTALASYASQGIFFATHSVGLARSIGDRVYSLHRATDGVAVSPLEGTRNYAEFLGELSFSSYRELGFDQVLLVEGVTDVKLVQQFLRFLNKEHNIVILPLGGDQLARGGVEAELSEIKRISERVSALVDSERIGPDGQASKNRLEFVKTCHKLGFDVCLTNRRATENYLADHAVKSEFGSSYRALGPYEKLNDVLPTWSKDANWKIARRMTWDDIKTTDVGQFLDKL